MLPGKAHESEDVDLCLIEQGGGLGEIGALASAARDCSTGSSAACDGAKLLEAKFSIFTQSIFARIEQG
jgi:hypothetical protein